MPRRTPAPPPVTRADSINRPTRSTDAHAVLPQWREIGDALDTATRMPELPAGAGPLMRRCAAVSMLTGVPLTDLLAFSRRQSSPVAPLSIAAHLLATLADLEEYIADVASEIPPAAHAPGFVACLGGSGPRAFALEQRAWKALEHQRARKAGPRTTRRSRAA